LAGTRKARRNNGFFEEQTAKLSGLDIIEVKALSEAL
jgi:hypothetical protein